MLKEPVAGRVKTRLAASIGTVRATAFARRLGHTLLARLATGPWHLQLAVAPDRAVASPMWPARVQRNAQGGGDLGRRMQRIMDRLPPGPVVIVGGDIPEVSARHIREAFRRLGACDGVFGPSPDGGYWLVGLSRRLRVPKAFADVRWSSEHALADTRANLAGLRLAEVAQLSDVDEVEDWLRFSAIAGRRVLPAASVSPAGDALPGGA